MTRLKISSATLARHFGPNNVVIRKYDAVIERIYFDCEYLSQSNRTKHFTFWKQQLKWKIRERGERKMEFFRQKERTKRNMVISIGSIHKKNKKYCWWNSTPFDLYIRNDSARHFFLFNPIHIALELSLSPSQVSLCWTNNLFELAYCLHRYNHNPMH